MIVEFLGNTGAGKSTLVPILVRLLQEKDVNAVTATEAILRHTAETPLGRGICALAPELLRRPLLWRLFWGLMAQRHLAQFAIEQRQLANYVVRSQLRRSIPLRHRWYVLRHFAYYAIEYHFLSRHLAPGEVLVIDEGFVHKAVSLSVSDREPLDRDHVAHYLGLLPRSGLVVWVRAANTTCAERICARGLQERLRDRTLDDIARFVENADQAAALASQCLTEAGWSVIEVGNDGDLAGCTGQVDRYVLPPLLRMVNLSAATTGGFANV